MPLLAASSSFSLFDWVVLGLYFVMLVGSGVWLSRKQAGTEDYFLASRKMPAWAVAVSVLASSLSAATFLGAPQQAFAGNLTYLLGNLGVIVAALIVAAFFIPVYYRLNVTTVYELLERRFGRGAKEASSWTFMLGRIFASGARIYIAGNALAYAMFGDLEPGHLLTAVAILSIAGIVYTIAGGIETVIWTDVVQTAVFLIAVVAVAAVLLMKIPASTGEIIGALAHPGDGAASKLTLIDLSTDPSKPWTLWTALTGVMLLNLAAMGTDHDLAQRMLTCRSAWQGSKSVLLSVAMSVPTVLLFMMVGLLLWIFYTRPDLMGAAAPQPLPPGDASRRVFLHFITTELPSGMSGLMIAGLFAVGLGSLDSALNAMSATFVNDFYKRRRPGRDEKHYLLVGRIGVVVWGVLLGLFACLCIWWQRSGGQTFIDFALGVMTFAYGGLLAVFLCAIFTRRGTSASAVAALAAGFLVTLAMEPTLLNSLAASGVLDQESWIVRRVAPLAWPWRMVAATGAAFVVCAAGRKREAVKS